MLQPNDLDSYYKSRDLVPADMLADLHRAEILITNYHAFKPREEMELAKSTRELLKGRDGKLNTREPDGKMLQRVLPGLMSIRNILVLNDEAHHCYREKPGGSDERDLSAEEKEEAKQNKEAARLWIFGLEAVGRRLGIRRMVDLSATPFFLRGSGYREGTLFPWTMSDFSLMDAIECSIVKLPPSAGGRRHAGRGSADVPQLVGAHRRADAQEKRQERRGARLAKLPTQWCTALDALYGHYRDTCDAWRKEGVGVEPCFIIVCQNTSASRLIYEYISGFTREDEAGGDKRFPGHFDLFRNDDEHGNPLRRPRTLLIDSAQLESGDALDPAFRAAAGPEIERFRRERRERGNQSESTDQDLLREVMNTVGKPGRLGESIRCVVSVSMLTEGWDANTVTHVLGSALSVRSCCVSRSSAAPCAAPPTN